MARILVVHTGGTIGMAPGPEGLRPAAGLVEAALQALAPEALTIKVLAFDPLVDSADIGPADWNRITDAVAGWQGDGVLVTHGTDTMAFTGAALSAALAGIAMPVVLCGSMKPLGMGGDAEANLALALQAVQGGRAGVWLAFAGRLMPASGLVKHHASEADAFRVVPQQPDPGPFRPRHFADLRLAILTLSPGLPASALAAMLAELDGAVLRVFGAGTMMADPAMAAVLTAAVARGCALRAVSQCEAGGLAEGAYAAGEALWRAGVENGGAETAEVAMVRLWLALSDQRAGRG